MLPITKQKVTARVAAETALDRDGLILAFDNFDYPTPDACRKAAMRFRMAFYTMRNKERRQDHYWFDSLVCLIEEQPNGWQVSLQPETSLVGVVGEPIECLTPEYQRWLALRQEATDCRGYAGVASLDIEPRPTQPCPFEEEDEAFFWSYDPEKARAVYDDLEWPLPAFVKRELNA